MLLRRRAGGGVNGDDGRLRGHRSGGGRRGRGRVMQILQAVPDARLVIQAQAGSAMWVFSRTMRS